jgi:TPR repeat protein
MGRRAVFSALLWAGIIGGAQADFEAGQKAFEAGDHAAAFREWRPLAEAGNAKAQLQIAHLYFNGRGVSRSYVKAVRWYREAGAQGEAEAQVILGNGYEGGIYGLTVDLVQAAAWYRKAAEQNHGVAAFMLGVLLSEGRGVARDDVEAAKWYLISVEQGPDHHRYSAALYALGVVYETGSGVSQDHVEALKWYELAESSDTSVNLGWYWWAAQARTELAAKMAQEQIVEAHRAALVWTANKSKP